MSGKGQIIVVSIYLEPTQATKIMKFPADIPIHSIIADIQKIQGVGTQGRDHGLYRAPIKATLTAPAVSGLWLERSRTLKYYNIKNNQLLEYKKKHRPISIKLIDESEHSFVVDDSQSVRKISDKLGELLQLSAKDSEQFCLCWPGSTIKKPLWLEEGLSLHEQPDYQTLLEKGMKKKEKEVQTPRKMGDLTSPRKEKKKEPEIVIPTGAPLLFWKRYYAHDSDISKITNPFILNIYFVGIMKQILKGLFPLGRVDAKNFGALQLQALHGKFQDGFAIQPSDFLPPNFVVDKKLPLEVLGEWKNLGEAKPDTAKNRYIQLARSMRTYGMTFYDFTETKIDEVATKKSRKQKFIVTNVTLAISSKQIAYYSYESNQFTRVIPYTSLRRYELLLEMLTLIVKADDDGSETLQLESKYAEEAYAMIEGYIGIILRERSDTQKVVTDESGSIAEMEDDDAKWFTSGVQTQGRGFNNPHGFNNFGWPGMMGGQFGTMDENRMMNHASNLEDAIKGMKGISDHLASKKGVWGKKQTEAEWNKDLSNANAFLAPALADFFEQCRLNDKSNRKMLDHTARNVYTHALNMTQAAQQLAMLNDDYAALLDGAKAVADSLADILSLCSDEKNPPSEELLDACLKQHNILMHLLRNPELLHHIDPGSEYLLLNCLYDVDNQVNMLLTEALKNPEKIAAAKLATQVKGLALSALAALIPYASSPEVLGQISIAEEMIIEAMAPLGLDMTKLKDSIRLLGVGKTICENSLIDGNIDITTHASDLIRVLALIRAEATNGNLNEIYQQLAQVQEIHDILSSNIDLLIPHTDEKLSDRLVKAQKCLKDEIEQLKMDINMLMADPQLSQEAKLQMVGKILQKIGKLEEQAQLLITDVGVLTTLNNLRHHSKQVAADMIRLKTVATVTAQHVPKQQGDKLNAASKEISDSLSELFTILKDARDNPNNLMTQTKLMNVVQKEMPSWEVLINVSEDNVENLQYKGDDKNERMFIENVKLKLEDGVSDASKSTNALKRAVRRMGELEGNILISQALMDLEMIKASVENAEVMASQGQLPFDHRLDAIASAIKVQKASEKFVANANALVKASTQDDFGETMPELIMNTVNALERLVATQQNLAGITSDKRLQALILGISNQTVQDSINLIAVSRLINSADITDDEIDMAKQAQQKLLAHLVTLQTSYGESDYEEIKSLKDDIERKKFKIAMGPLQSANRTQPIVERQALLLARALTITTNQLVDAILYTPAQTRFPLSAFAGVAVDLMEQFAYHPKLNNEIKDLVQNFHEDVVKVIDTVQILGKERTQDNIDVLLNVSQEPIKTLKGILEKLLGETKLEVNQAVLDIMRLIDDLENNKITAYPTIKPEVLSDISSNISALTSAIEPISHSNDLATSDQNKLIEVAKESAKVASQIVVTAQSSKRNKNEQPISITATRVIQSCDIAAKNNHNKPILENVSKVTPANINALIHASKNTIKKEKDAKKLNTQCQRLEEVVIASKPFIQATNKGDAEQVAKTSDELKKKVLALEESLYTFPKDPNQLNTYAFTPTESQRLCNVSNAVAISTANLIQNSLIKPKDCASEEIYHEKQKKAQQELESNIRELSKLITDQAETKDLIQKTIEIVRLGSYQLIAAENTVTFGQSLALPDDFSRENSTHAADAYDSTLQCIVNVKNILDAYKTNNPTKLTNAIFDFKAAMSNFPNQIVTTCALMNDANIQKDLLKPSSTFALQLIPLLKTIELNDVSDTKGFQAIVQSAIPVINTLKELNQKLTNQRSNQERIDKLISEINNSMKADGPPSNRSKYEQNRADLIGDVHKVGLDLSQLVNSHHNVDLILQNLESLSNSTIAFIEKSKATAKSCDDPSVQSTLNELTENVGKGVVKALGYSKDEIIGINLHSQQLNNFHNSAAEIDKVVSLLTSVEKVLLEGTSAEILKSIGDLSKLKLMIQTGEIEKLDGYKEKSAKNLSSVSPVVTNNGKQLSGAFDQLLNVKDHEVGTQANNLSTAVKNFDDSIYDAVFAIDNKETQLALLDDAIEATILASSALNPRIGLTRKDVVQDGKKEVQNCVQRVQNAISQEEQEKKINEQKHKQTIAKMREQFQPAQLNSIPKKGNANSNVLVQDCQEIIATIAEANSAPTFDESVQISEKLPGLIKNLLSTEISLPDLDDALKQDFIEATKDLSESLVDYLETPRNPVTGQVDDQKIKPKLEKIQNSTAEVVKLTQRLPEALTVDLSIDSSAKDIEQQTENELMKCAAMINDAVKLLSSVQPGAKRNNVGISTADISEAILEAARAVGMGVSDLVNAACQVQSERKTASIYSSKYNVDPAWSNGLVSAAQLVTENVRQLVTAANNTAKGGEMSEEERLVAISKAVSAVTVALLQASRSKAEDPTAQSQRALTKAAQAVQVSTGNLVIAAQAAQELKETEEKDDFSKVDFKSASGLRAQMEQMGKIEKLEKELRDNHQELIKLRRARYQNKS